MHDSPRLAEARVGHVWRFPLTASLVLVALLTLVFAAMRATGIFGPQSLRWLLPLGFVLMAVSPWVLLTRVGRAEIGLRKPQGGLAVALAFGALAAIACFVIGVTLFGASEDHWYVTIAENYRRTMKTAGFSIAQLYLIFTLPALLFSPIGEEIFFRGVVQRALEERFSIRNSTLIECAIFGLVHLCHHGIVAGATGLRMLPVSGAIWVVLMFGVGFLFAWLKRRACSLLTAMVSHAAFNAAMNLCIFAWLWHR